MTGHWSPMPFSVLPKVQGLKPGLGKSCRRPDRNGRPKLPGFVAVYTAGCEFSKAPFSRNQRNHLIGPRLARSKSFEHVNLWA